jgi:hypothetical protein
MTEPKFTEGPWLNQENMEGYADIVIPGEYIARVAKETNANLIAAAPDLYAALKSLADYEMPDQSGPATARRWGYALDALNKAVKA